MKTFFLLSLYSVLLSLVVQATAQTQFAGNCSAAEERKAQEWVNELEPISLQYQQKTVRATWNHITNINTATHLLEVS